MECGRVDMDDVEAFLPFGDSDGPDVAASEGLENVSLRKSTAIYDTSIPIVMDGTQIKGRQTWESSFGKASYAHGVMGKLTSGMVTSGPNSPW